MLYNKESHKLLSTPFPVDGLKFRPGPTNKQKTMAIPLTYIDQRDAIERLDDVLGPENWQCTYMSEGTRLTCSISVMTEHGWITKSNGAGDTDIEEVKGGYSDAFKRAAVLLGVGKYLYDMKLGWFPIENNRFTERVQHEIRESIKGVENVLNQDTAPKSTEANSDVPPKGVNVTTAKKRAKEFVESLEKVETEEDLLTIVCADMDLFAKLDDHDDSRKGHSGNINWWRHNDPSETDFVGLRDRITNVARTKFGYDASTRMDSILGEHNI